MLKNEYLLFSIYCLVHTWKDQRRYSRERAEVQILYINDICVSYFQPELRSRVEDYQVAEGNVQVGLF